MDNSMSVKSEERSKRKEELEKKLSEIEAQKKKEQLQYEEELESIKSEEAREKDMDDYNRLFSILENGQFLLSLMKHGRTSCSDKDPVNHYLRNGVPRCKKCAFIHALDDWDSNKDWLSETKSGEQVLDIINLSCIDIDIVLY